MEARAIIRSDGAEDATDLADSVPWWSFTKTVLAIALVRFSEQGRCDLDGLVGDQPYTLAQLLRHEAGLPDDGSIARYQADVKAAQTGVLIGARWSREHSVEHAIPPNDDMEHDGGKVQQ